MLIKLKAPGARRDYAPCCLELTVERAFQAQAILREAGVECKIDSISSPNLVTFRLYDSEGSLRDHAAKGKA